MEMAKKTKLKVKSEKLKFFNKIIPIVLLTVIIFNVGSVVWHQKGKYLSKDYWQRFPTLKKVYYDSIYANKKGGFIPDQTIYSFNGGALIRGESPILVSPEVPPLGKYLIGLSAFLFNNEHIVILICSTFSLILLCLIGKQIYSSVLIALFPPFFLSFEPIFLNQLRYTPLLDIIHLTFLLGSFYLFNLFLKSKKNSIFYAFLTSLFFGFFISTKFFGLGIPLFLSFVLILLMNKKFQKLKLFLASAPVSLSVLLLSYIRVLIIGYPLNKFLGIQKWVYWYNQGHLRLPFSVWPLILFNKWHTSWSTSVLSDPQWQSTWPLLTVASLTTIIFYFFGKIKKRNEIEILMAWTVIYFLFLSFGDANARYFVILMPIMYMVSIFGIKILIERLLKHENFD